MSCQINLTNYQLLLLRRDPVDGSYLIDRTATYFEPILNFLRTGSLIINPNVNAEGKVISINNWKYCKIKYINKKWVVIYCINFSVPSFFTKVFMKKQSILELRNYCHNLNQLSKNPTKSQMNAPCLEET